MAPHTTSELAALVHDLCGALEQHPVDAPDVRDAAQAVLNALVPLAARETVAPDAQPPAGWASSQPGPATWTDEAPPSEGTWAPDALEAGTWAPGALSSEVPAPAETQWEQGPGLQAPKPAVPSPAAVDLSDWCQRILAGDVGATEARDALLRWRPAEGVADKGGRYVVAAELGRGGMGQVLQADDVYLRRTVAIKVLTLPSAAARRRFVEEARLTARLAHPGVVPVHDVGETPDGKPFFAMKRIEGRSLHGVIHTGEMPGLAERLDVFKRVCEAVAYAHDAGVLHLDLKPDNVMVGDYGEVLVVDWGLATEVGDGGAAMRQVAGTPSYMAPEQATAGLPLDRRTDVYALGAMLYELLTDQAPIEAGAVTEMLEQVRAGTIPHARSVRPDVPRELDALVQRCMARDPAQRPTGALFLRDEIRAFQEHRELQTLQYGMWSRLEKWRQRNLALVRGLAVAGTMGTLALVAATSVYVVQITQARTEAEQQAHLAKVGQAETQLYLGRSHLVSDRFGAAKTALQDARRQLEGLGLPTVRADLALAEVASAGSHVQTVELPFAATSLATDGEVVLLASATQSTRLDLASQSFSPGPPAARPKRSSLGLVWIQQREEGGHQIQTADGSWSITIPIDGTMSLIGDTAYAKDRPVAYQLTPTADGGMSATTLPMDHGVCAGRTTSVHGPFVRCEMKSGPIGVDGRTGEQAGLPLAVGDHGTHHLPAHTLRVMVRDAGDQHIWEHPTRAVGSTTYVEGLGWLDEAGRIRAHTWASGRIELDLDASMVPSGPIAVAPEEQLALVLEKDRLHTLRPISAMLEHPTNAAALFPYAVAIGPEGAVFADLHRVFRTPTAGAGSATWSSHPAKAPRDAAWADDGRLAVALRNTGVMIVAPDGTEALHPHPKCCLAVAWRGGVLAASGRTEDLHVLEDGNWRTVPVPELKKGGWDIAPWGVSGWVVSDYDMDTVHALIIDDGKVVSRIEGEKKAHAFQVATQGSHVVVATGNGAFAWDGEATQQLTTSYAVATVWAPTGPVVGGSDQQLQFFDPSGTLLHAWNLKGVPVALATDGQHMLASFQDQVRILPLAAD